MLNAVAFGPRNSIKQKNITSNKTTPIGIYMILFCVCFAYLFSNISFTIELCIILILIALFFNTNILLLLKRYGIETNICSHKHKNSKKKKKH